MPHYPPPGLCRGKGGAFNLVLMPKHAPYVGNLTDRHMHVRKCAIIKKLHVLEKVLDGWGEGWNLTDWYAQ